MGTAVGQTSGIEKTVKGTAAIATAYTIAKWGADDETMSVAAAATDNMLGIFQHTTDAAGERVRVMKTGISRLVLGATVTRGDPITSNATGRGIQATLGQNYIGFAEASGVSGDIIPVSIMPGMIAPNQGVDGNGFLHVARATYDFSVEGGEIGDVALGVTLPDNAVITFGFGDIITSFTSTGGTGTIALKSEGAADLLAAVDADTLSGQFALIPDNAVANMVKLTAARELTLTIGTATITAGKAVFFVYYIISD